MIMSEKKILIVDDERDFAYVLSTHLRAHGYNTITASDAVRAIAAAQKERPDFIILDIIPTALNKFAFDVSCSANRFDFLGV